jgi:hypothetical protein
MSSATSAEAFQPEAEAEAAPASVHAPADAPGGGPYRPATGRESSGPSTSSIAIGVVFGLGVWCLIGYVGFELYEYLS